MIERSLHPTPAELARFAMAQGEPDPRVDAAAVARHLAAGCGTCAATVHRLRERAREIPFAPDRARPDWTVPRRLAVTAHGFRGGAPACDQQLFCETGDFEVNVLVHADVTGEVEIGGQILRSGRGAPAAHVALQLVDAETLAVEDSAATDELGEFVLFGLPGKSYGLRLAETGAAHYVLVSES